MGTEPLKAFGSTARFLRRRLPVLSCGRVDQTLLNGLGTYEWRFPILLS